MYLLPLAIAARGRQRAALNCCRNQLESLRQWGATKLIALIDSGEQCKLSKSHCQLHLITNATWTPLARKAIRLMHIHMPRTEGRLRRGCHIAAKTIRRSTVGAAQRATVRHGHGHGNEEALREAHCA